MVEIPPLGFGRDVQRCSAARALVGSVLVACRCLAPCRRSRSRPRWRHHARHAPWLAQGPQGLLLFPPPVDFGRAKRPLRGRGVFFWVVPGV